METPSPPIDPVLDPTADTVIVRTHVAKKPGNVSVFWAVVGLVYLAGAALLFFRPEGFFYLVNFFPAVLPYFAKTTAPTEYITVILASGFFLTQALVSFGIAFRPRLQFTAVILFVTKAAVAAACVHAYLHVQNTFALAAGALLEGLLGLVLLYRFATFFLRKNRA